MKGVLLITLMVSAFMMPPSEGFASLLNLGPEEIVQADGYDIMVPGYSVPSFVDWDNDGKKDLLVGEGGGFGDAKIRVYLNVGTKSNPQFSNYFCAQSDGFDLTCPAEGFTSCSPRVEYWDQDNRKDLLVGQPDGTVKIFLNIGTDENPTFDGGTNVKVGFSGTDLDVGERATPTTVDWDNDGKKDLVAGALDGKIHIYFNCGCGGAIPPRFLYSPSYGAFAQENGQDLVVPSLRSSPVVLDLDGDGRKDLLTGNTEGQLLFYSNVGTDEEPSFSGYSLVESNGAAIQVDAVTGATPRSRPFVCDWTDDSYLDVLIGASDGKVHLYQANSGTDDGDIDVDGDVDFADFTLFAPYWRQTDCAQCGGADFTNDGKVDIDDLRLFAASWLTGVHWLEIYAAEDFETGDFSGLPWEHAGDANWAVAPWHKHSGTYSAEAGTIGDNKSTTLQVTLDCVSGNISFYRKVSSELNSDHLKFYIDGVGKGKWSSEEDWAEMTFPVTAGKKTFTWTYSKDGSVSKGNDTAWIDDIVFTAD
jgi:hypothetical protein